MISRTTRNGNNCSVVFSGAFVLRQLARVAGLVIPLTTKLQGKFLLQYSNFKLVDRLWKEPVNYTYRITTKISCLTPCGSNEVRRKQALLSRALIGQLAVFSYRHPSKAQVSVKPRPSASAFLNLVMAFGPNSVCTAGIYVGSTQWSRRAASNSEHKQTRKEAWSDFAEFYKHTASLGIVVIFRVCHCQAAL